MNTSNKTLLQILIEELPNRGGWPEYSTGCRQYPDGDIVFRGVGVEFNFRAELANDVELVWRATTELHITRDQYEAALAAIPTADEYGWIQWAGGECPVDGDAIVEVRYRKTNQYQFNNDRAGDFTWSHHGIDGDIIAYRLQQPHEVKTAGIDVQRDAVKSNDAQLEADLNDCIGQGIQADEKARNALLVDIARAGIDVSLIAAYDLADFLIAQGYRKQ